MAGRMTSDTPASLAAGIDVRPLSVRRTPWKSLQRRAVRSRRRARKG